MIRIHAFTIHHAREIASSQGWLPKDWELFRLQAVRGLSQPIVVTCACVPLEEHWKDYLRTTSTIVVKISCPRCQHEIADTLNRVANTYVWPEYGDASNS